MDILRFILFLIFILFYKELLSSFFFILLDNLLMNLKGKFYYAIYIN